MAEDAGGGSYGTIDDLAAAEKINSSYVSGILRLTLLAPDLVEATLNGWQPEGMTLPALMEPFPVEWEGQDLTFAQVKATSASPDPAAAPGAAAWSMQSGTGSAR